MPPKSEGPRSPQVMPPSPLPPPHLLGQNEPGGRSPSHRRAVPGRAGGWKRLRSGPDSADPHPAHLHACREASTLRAAPAAEDNRAAVGEPSPEGPAEAPAARCPGRGHHPASPTSAGPRGAKPTRARPSRRCLPSGIRRPPRAGGGRRAAAQQEHQAEGARGRTRQPRRRRPDSRQARPRPAPRAAHLPRPAPRRLAANHSAAHVTSAACDDLIPGVG